MLLFNIIINKFMNNNIHLKQNFEHRKPFEILSGKIDLNLKKVWYVFMYGGETWIQQVVRQG